MRYSASEKLEIIELVEQSTLSVGRTLASMAYRLIGKPWPVDGEAAFSRTSS